MRYRCSGESQYLKGLLLAMHLHYVLHFLLTGIGSPGILSWENWDDIHLVNCHNCIFTKLLSNLTDIPDICFKDPTTAPTDDPLEGFTGLGVIVLTAVVGVRKGKDPSDCVWRNIQASYLLSLPPGKVTWSLLLSLAVKCVNMCTVFLPREAHWRLGVKGFYWNYSKR